MKRIWSNKYVLIVNAISIMVAFLTHFPELITLSNPYSADRLSFPGMHWADVGNEVLFTYLSLLFLFFLNEAVSVSIAIWFLSGGKRWFVRLC